MKEDKEKEEEEFRKRYLSLLKAVAELYLVLLKAVAEFYEYLAELLEEQS